MSGEQQSSGTVLMVRPASFGFHREAAASNAFASISTDDGVRAHAIREWEQLTRRLGDAGVEVLMLEDNPVPAKPDAVFPNNWISFHGDGTMVLYPMATERRRLERDTVAIGKLLARARFAAGRTMDLSAHERAGRFLEGTGSLILDRPRRRAYASRSIRTDARVIAEFDRQLGYSTLLFDAFDGAGNPIYHTNVLLSLGTEFAILCGDVVPEGQRRALIADIEESGRTVIIVGYEQMRQFACNILELHGTGGPVIALSSASLKSFSSEQLRPLERFGQLVDADVRTIEGIGGGSVRCMIADVHLPRG